MNANTAKNTSGGTPLNVAIPQLLEFRKVMPQMQNDDAALHFCSIHR
jgi:hypothetical protein